MTSTDSICQRISAERLVVRVTDRVRALIAQGQSEVVVTVVPTLADTAGIAVEGDLERPLQFEQLGLVTYDR